ncbi:putative toxin-antitoxin system toxin component, PIN family [Candidatus Gottesmanbacteria bacterium RIFCSPLOWO2_01_FULL_39_12b]|uniref:Putative toxin-antitoxin system toxin component, PIN family n=1 Tax=Candidatus Gottesmanbacteria bacterium RIFCSPLOWO2_01_FULL_39_12b TaxID=1798388 RepID=A0A1F6AS84_9BACT|nr:MAG: putative toxin-antitoxin system toxin component, PIN family [Candidatus Gottesmanbacteria bacterium RIFCSPLOWO2_01_FULL_39_12b]
MYRVVVDTNLIISGATTSGTIPSEVIESWRRDEYILVTSPRIIEEVKEVLNRPKIKKQFSFTSKEIDKLIESLITKAFVTPGILEVEVIKDDPDDNKFIACAIEGSATHIISGDKKHVLSLGDYQGIKIVSARNFLEAYLKKDVL